MLMKGKPAYVPHYHLEVEDIIGLIKAAGGTPVLAHPKLIGDDRLVEELCCRGIEGLEVFYPQHDETDTALPRHGENPSAARDGRLRLPWLRDALPAATSASSPSMTAGRRNYTARL